jgi:hypothetical protein
VTLFAVGMLRQNPVHSLSSIITASSSLLNLGLKAMNFKQLPLKPCLSALLLSWFAMTGLF